MITRYASNTVLETVTRALIGTSLLVGFGVVVLAARSVIDARAATQLEADTATQNARLTKLQKELPKNSGARARAKGFDVLRVLQDSVTQSALRNACQLAEFRASTQIAPYTPRYTKATPSAPWTQMDVHFTLNGRLRDVVDTLRSINSFEVPVEVDAVNLTRQQVLPDGSATITAQVDLRALAEGAPS